MKFDHPVVVSASVGFVLGAIFTLGLRDVVSSPASRLDVRELRIMADDHRPAAILAVERDGAVLRFLDNVTGNTRLELGTRDREKFLVFHGPNANPVAAITSLPPDGATTLYLGDAHVSPRIVFGAMPEQRLPTGEVDGWELQFRNPHNVDESLFRVLVQADRETGKPYASFTVNGKGMTVLQDQERK